MQILISILINPRMYKSQDWERGVERRFFLCASCGFQKSDFVSTRGFGRASTRRAGRTNTSTERCQQMFACFQVDILIVLVSCGRARLPLGDKITLEKYEYIFSYTSKVLNFCFCFAL